MPNPKGINEVNSNDWEHSDSVGEMVEEVAQDVGVGAREATAVFKDGKVRLTATPPFARKRHEGSTCGKRPECKVRGSRNQLTVRSNYLPGDSLRRGILCYRHFLLSDNGYLLLIHFFHTRTRERVSQLLAQKVNAPIFPLPMSYARY